MKSMIARGHTQSEFAYALRDAVTGIWQASSEFRSLMHSSSEHI
ncbi:MAG: hypothetical protein WAQ08_18355 [Aquabacterium sp.]